jgi:CyaY protein
MESAKILMVAGKIGVTQGISDSEFEALADAALAALERAIEASALEADVQSKGAGVLEVEFENGSRMVINRHSAAREIWVAARSGGFHFRHDGAAWRDTRDGSELFAAVSRLASEQAGVAVRLNPRG